MGHYYEFPREIVALEVQVGYEWQPSFSMPTLPSMTVYVATVQQFLLLLWSLLSTYSPQQFVFLSWSLHSPYSPNIFGKTSYKQQVFVLPLLSEDCGLV
jgi:hypothetical protein